MIVLTPKHVKDVCTGLGGSHRCRFLSQDENDYTKWYCMKKTGKAAIIEAEYKQYIEDCSKRGTDPASANFPLADNCEGYPLLRHIKQGYDC